MKRLTYILWVLALLVAFSHNLSATRQVRDIIIIDKVEHRLNQVLLYQLDSVTYDALEKKLEFDKFSYSANWRGQDGEWHWIYPNIACPLKFNTSEDTI